MRARFGVYQTLVRVFPAAADTAQAEAVTSPGRQNEWMSSASPTVAGGSPAWFHPAMRNSQLPAAGVPDPPPTEVAGSSAMTVDCSAGGMFWRLAGWLNVAAHWFTTTIAPARVTRPEPDACPANDPAACLVPSAVPDADAYPASDVTTGVPPRPVPDACPANDPAACLVAAVVPDPDAYPERTPAGAMLPVAEPVPDATPDTGEVKAAG